MLDSRPTLIKMRIMLFMG